MVDPAKVHRVRLGVTCVLAALLWFGSGLFSHLLLDTRLSQPAELLLPVTVPRMMWVWPDMWGAIGITLAVIAFATLSWTLLTLTTLRAPQSLLAVWLLIALAATATGFAVGVGQLVAHIPLMGFSAFSLDPVQFALGGAYWGVLYGWIPALVARKGSFRATDPSGMHGTQAVRSAEEARNLEWCTPEQAVLLLGTPDAATGHRVQPIRLMNFSEEECVVEGYPDIAFEDQNGNLLDVVLSRGGSFMADDPGPAPVTVPPGGQAVTYLGWNANSTHNELVVFAIHAAQVAGDTRASWSGQPGLDIIEGSEVFVTAWALDEPDSLAN